MFGQKQLSSTARNHRVSLEQLLLALYNSTCDKVALQVMIIGERKVTRAATIEVTLLYLFL